MRFTIRDLFLVTLIVALAVGWWIARTQNEKLHKKNTSLAKNAAELERRNKALQTPLAPFRSNGDVRSVIIEKPPPPDDNLPIHQHPPQTPPRDELAGSDCRGENDLQRFVPMKLQTAAQV